MRKPSLPNVDALIHKWVQLTVIYSVLLVLGCTLSPYDFQFQEKITRFSFEFHLQDVLNNILLFAPLGFGLSWTFHNRKLRRTVAIVIVLVTGATFSSLVETLQFFLPSRNASILDIFTNSLGATLGFFCFHLVLKHKDRRPVSALLTNGKKHFSASKFATGFAGYAILMFSLSIFFQNAANLNNWDPTFPLFLGNEHEYRRPWRGYISEFQMADRAISTEEIARIFSGKSPWEATEKSLVASYRFTEAKDSYADQSGHLPDLFWQGKGPGTQDERGVLLGPEHWLRTADAATVLTQKIRERSQFTLITTVAPVDTAQYGPARIISLSYGHFLRNFTLGQDGTHLVFRVRTPITGKNGLSPQFVIPRTFTDASPHRLVIIYDKWVLKIYIDGLQQLHVLELVPEIALFVHLFPFRYSIEDHEMLYRGYRMLYYGFVFIPLGIFLALMAETPRPFLPQTLLICGGVLLPTLILEGILAGMVDRDLKLENLILGMVMTAGPVVLSFAMDKTHKQRTQEVLT